MEIMWKFIIFRKLIDNFFDFPTPHLFFLHSLLYFGFKDDVVLVFVVEVECRKTVI